MVNTIDITNKQFSKDRACFRNELINLFLDEKPGIGKGDETSRYTYIVKRIGAHEVYLSRPAQFNNGFDFTLNVSNVNFNLGGRATSRPTHQNILSDLLDKKSENLKLYTNLITELKKLYNCEQPTKVNFPFKGGYKTELILECIKWLFVEQDVTYWNYSGRAMFYNAIMEI